MEEDRHNVLPAGKGRSLPQRRKMIKVGIVDDHAILRIGVRNLLAKQDDMCVVGEAVNAAGAIELVRVHEIDVLLLDLLMPQRSGMDIIALLRAKAPDTAILVFSAYPPEHYAVGLLRDGVRGYVSKGGPLTEVVDAIRAVAGGKYHISPEIGELLVQQVISKEDQSAHSQLTMREFQVFLHLARGQAVGEVADILSISPATVSTYRSRIMEKMGFGSNSDMTYYALKKGLID